MSDGHCPVPGCTSGRKHGHLMCLAHWRRVPKILQRQVWDTWNALGQARDLDSDAFELVLKYRAASDEAVRVAGLPK